MSETPQYRLLSEAFFQPDLLPAGSIIATEATPGPHMEPWNEAAQARYEAWLNEEWDELDPKTKDRTGKKFKPHAQYRRVEYVATPLQTAEVIQAPEAAEAGGKTLADLQVRKSTDQRPPASRQFKTISPMEAAPKTAAVLEAGPPTSSVKGGPGGN